MRRLSNIYVMVILFISAGLLTSGEAQQLTKSFKVAKGGLLKINVNNGDISIRTWEKSEVKVNMEDVSDSDEIKAHQIKIYKSGNDVIVENKFGGSWSGSNDVSVTVPEEYNINAKTNQGDVDIRSDINGAVKVFTAGGDINVKSSAGQVSLESYGGDIYARNIGGDADISTKGGDIEIGSVNGNAGLNTLGGSITVGNVLKNLKASTNGGEIKTGNIGGKLEAKTLGGEIEIHSVKLGVTVKTNGGNIKLNGSGGPVNAVTLGGDIDLYKISGPVDVKTYAGNIHVELGSAGKSSSHISTLSGDISLYINSAAKATIKTRAINGDYSADRKPIVSDFSPQSYETSKYTGFTNATYELNGGGPEISLKTLNGGIEIRKLK